MNPPLTRSGCANNTYVPCTLSAIERHWPRVLDVHPAVSRAAGEQIAQRRRWAEGYPQGHGSGESREEFRAARRAIREAESQVFGFG